MNKEKLSTDWCIIMSKAEHIDRHKELHDALDKLMADFFSIPKSF